MIISYNWLKEYLDFDLSPQELEDKLTFAGIEVESIKQIGEDLRQIIIGKIVHKEKHPQADKLSVCRIDDGQEIKQVICGAPNCAVEQKIALAPVGASIGDFKIKKVKLRGEISLGMICSEKELGISEDHDGIMVLPEDAPIGENLASYLDLEDTVYEVEITPNRPDLLGIFGVARDLSALLNIKLKKPAIELRSSENKIETILALENHEPELCPRYTAKVIQGVTIKESPEWLKQRLLAVGLRPINNVVDITNFVMMEFGHPLHAFDLSKVTNKKIIVRRADKNEKLPALDDNTYELLETDIVIADAEKPIALAGVIGATNSHITETTKNIVIEAANFLYSSIRKTAGRLKISTDSSYRFERNLSDETVEIASDRAAQLILEIAGGQLLSGMLDSFPDPKSELFVIVRPSRIKKLLSIDISDSQIIKYLTSLDLKYTKPPNSKTLIDGGLGFIIPPYRKDLTREIDLIEEIIRLYGYNNVKPLLQPKTIMNRKSFYSRRKVQDILINNGFLEVVNWSFADPEDLNKFEIAEDDERRNTTKIKNPPGSSFSIMRTMLIPQILKNALYNFNHSQNDLKLFESSRIYFRKDEKLSTEKHHISGLMAGNLSPVWWKEKQKPVDFFDLKGIIEEILNSFGLLEISYENSSEPFYQPGLAADINIKKQNFGSFGKLDQKITRKYNIEQPVFVFDLKLNDLIDHKISDEIVFRSIPRFPVVQRDLAFVVSEEFDLHQIKRSILESNRKFIKKIVLFDEYKGKNIKKGFRSLAFGFTLGSDEKTLTDDSIKAIINKIISKLQKEFKIEMR